MKPDITPDLQIAAYMHCGLCLEQKPNDISPQDWARLSAGWTDRGLQVWCDRHNCNVLNIDFEGHKLPAITSRRLPDDDKPE